ncbi:MULTISPECIES: replication-relaxation family protein [Bacillus cereus group]|uniref:Replication-relaxation family protein n=1 Tax=Bacillus cereus TaxID=1396 RepID=A0A9X7M3N5_BACCE|nr:MULTISPECIES: replication-relaxation family protein [Bacillus cereus group]MCQ6288118.1 replication-relaxation family protein [Bacillus cereus]MCQ6316535.1 replication-relaxation family protein [Bacillus cereus]MCQ6327666.1 replication-relaxation family protein [Bacillus cereus]MCQ6385144.1 replication-relaxation family protein [Bacillus cereus]MDM8365872.1 replication-relaxation family protein [Bacillus thuringiensis]
MIKYLVLSDQDKELLVKLHDFVYLDSDFIVEYVLTKYYGKPAVMHRLRTLEDAGYIKSFTVPIEFATKPVNVYTLTTFGVEIVEQIQGIVKWNRHWTTKLAPWYQHQLMLNRIVAWYQREADNYDLEVKDWIPESRATWQYTKNKPDVIKPDGLMIIGPKGSKDNLGLFIELERSIAKRQNTVQKVIRYNDFLIRGQELLEDYDIHVGFEAPVTDWRVLFIGGNAPNTIKTIRDILSVEEKEKYKLSIPVLVASRGDIEQDPFGAIYHYVLDEPEVKKEL